jgi:hypothetical protein
MPHATFNERTSANSQDSEGEPGVFVQEELQPLARSAGAPESSDPALAPLRRPTVLMCGQHGPSAGL